LTVVVIVVYVMCNKKHKNNERSTKKGQENEVTSLY
jgi:hypothetical protein